MTKVFQMNTADWWMAASLDEAKEDYAREFGPDLEDDSMSGARELTEAEMDLMQFTDEDGSLHSFRAELDARLAGGADKPGMFASTEF